MAMFGGRCGGRGKFLLAAGGTFAGSLLRGWVGWCFGCHGGAPREPPRGLRSNCTIPKSTAALAADFGSGPLLNSFGSFGVCGCCVSKSSPGNFLALLARRALTTRLFFGHRGVGCRHGWIGWVGRRLTHPRSSCTQQNTILTQPRSSEGFIYPPKSSPGH